MSEDAAADTDEPAEDPEGTTDPVPEDFVERIASYDESLASAAATLCEDRESFREQIDELEEQIDELETRLKRERADFENYKKRRKEQEQQLRERATESLIERIVSVRRDLQRALDETGQDYDDLREGVKITLRNLDRVLDAEDVERIEPDVGTSVDPRRHEVLARVDDEGPPGTIAEVVEPGFERGDRVLEEAQVVVVEDGSDDGESTGS